MAVAQAPSNGVRRRIIDGRVISVIVLLALWQAVTTITHVNPILVPSPTRIFLGLWKMAESGRLLQAIIFSTQTLVPGFLAATFIGVPLGILMGTYRSIRYLSDPYVSILLATPIIVFVPVLIVWFGLDSLTRIVASFIFAFPLIVINSQAGVRSIPFSLIEMGQSFEVPRNQMFWKILLPGALSSIVVGLRYGIAHAVKGVIIAEMLMTMSGLGGLIMAYSGAYRTGHLLAVVLISLLIVLIVTQIFNWLHRKVAPWETSNRPGSGTTAV